MRRAGLSHEPTNREGAQSDAADRFLNLVESERVLEQELKAVRIRSHTFEEQALADFFAEWMSDLGFEIEMMTVKHPKSDATTRQPIGRLRGAGDGPTLMFNGHLDTIEIATGWTVDPYAGVVRDGWVWGVGAHDDKGGLVAALCGIEAIRRAGVRLRGDILFCPVAAHKLGGVGTRALLAHGVRADACINIEHSTNTIATAIVGVVLAKIVTRNTGLFFRYSAEAKATYLNAIEQQALIIAQLGPSIEPPGEGSWMSFTAHPDLPDFPMHRFDCIHKDMYPRECEMILEIRSIPGQTDDSLRGDLMRAIESVKATHPNLHYAIALPAGGVDDTFHMPPCEIARDHPLVKALAQGQQLASGQPAVLGGGLRIGNVGDGNLIAAAEIPTVQYGPGDIRNYPEWPGPDERVEIRELVEAAKAMAYAAFAYSR